MNNHESLRRQPPHLLPPIPLRERVTIHGTLIRKALEKLTDEIVKSREDIVAAIKENGDKND
jgi:hypothetical protein